jgi:hypothetical protein
VGSFPSVKIGGSRSLRGFPRLEAGVVERDSTQSSRPESTSKTVANLSKFGFTRTKVGES